MLALLLPCLLGCTKTPTTPWRTHGSEGATVEGADYDRIEMTVLSHGWRILGGSSAKEDLCDWGWEVQVATAPSPAAKLQNEKDKAEGWTRIYQIDRVEYRLLDKDGFEVAADIHPAITLEGYGTNTLKHVGTVSRRVSDRAKTGRIRIVLRK